MEVLGESSIENAVAPSVSVEAKDDVVTVAESVAKVESVVAVEIELPESSLRLRGFANANEAERADMTSTLFIFQTLMHK